MATATKKPKPNPAPNPAPQQQQGTGTGTAQQQTGKPDGFTDPTVYSLVKHLDWNDPDD